MTILDGQLDALDLLLAEPIREYKLPFTASTGPGMYDFDTCAFCGTSKRLNEGGCGPAGFTGPSYWYQICDPCSERYRGKRPPRELWTFKEMP